MTPHAHRLLPLALLVSCLSAPDLNAQVILHPNYINGTVKFTNTNPAILSLLRAPGNLGVVSGAAYASSLPPAPLFQEAAGFNSVTATSGVYQITVDSDNPGIAYSVSAIVTMQPSLDTYTFAASNSAPVLSNGPPATVNLSESLTMLDIRFVNAASVPVPVTGGRILASIPGLGQLANCPQLATGATNHYLAVRGGTIQNLQVELIFGTNFLYDGFSIDIFTNITAVNDQVMVVYCVVPGTNGLGRIAGNVSLTGEFLEHTVMQAAYGPFNNVRDYILPGVNFTVPSSGPFLLTNLLPSDAVSPPQGYYVNAYMQIRTNLQYTSFTPPQLGYGNGSLVVVPAGGSVDLSNIFNITAGYMDGHITLLGPAETGPTNSLLRGVKRFIELAPSPTGIPNGADLYGNYYSLLSFMGVGRFAAGVTDYTAYGGASAPSLPGAYNALSHSFEGDFDAVVGGLKNENSVWRYNGLNLTMYSGDTADEATYYNENVDLQNNRTNDVEVAAGQHYTNDVGYCFGEVSIRFRAPLKRFFTPRVVVYGSPPGVFNGTDFQGNPANYEVFQVQAFGTPIGIGTATNTGFVRLLLPQGTYTLDPSITLVDTNGNYEDTGLPPITLTVGCQQRILIDQCLQMTLNLPGCTNTNPLVVSGSVASCTNVTQIIYQLGSGPTNTICNNCGVSPNFAFPLSFTPADICSNHTLVVTAYDASGQVSSVTSQLQFNNSPPFISCPGDITVSGCGTNGVPVTFAVTALGACSGPVTVQCVPASGSVFPPGVTTVICAAKDACGNTNTCSFHVTVAGPPLSIQQAIIITWACGGTLQSADNVNGPWTDIPSAVSPYCVAASQAKQFYRVRL